MKRKIYLLTVLPLFFLASCNNDEFSVPDKPATNTGDIEFNIGFAPQAQTRVSTDADFKSTWENGDEIGIFAVKRASGDTKALAATGNYMHNVKLTYSKTDDKWTGEAYYTNDGQVLDFYAYYPYIDNASIDPANITFNVLADQSTAANYNLSDLLSAAAPGIAKGTAVDLTFAHKLALVQVEVDPGAMKGSGPSENLAITLRNCLSGGAFDLRDGTLSTAGDAVAVKMLRVEKPADANYGEKYTYRALVPAQTVAQNSSLCLMAQGGFFYNTPKLAAELSLTAGAAKLYNAKLPVTALQTVKIPAGTFLMGSPDSEPNRRSDEIQHSVTLTKDFYMSKYAITSSQYAAFLNANNVGMDGKLDVAGYGEKVLFDENTWGWSSIWNTATNQWESARTSPMIYVSWFGAVAYCNWLSEQTGGTWRLPTEAEWEYACRAGTTTAYSFGADNISDYAVYGNDLGGGPSAVGTKLPNPLGLYDMHGNAFEWCSDLYGTYDTTKDTDPTGPTTGNNRVLRGGGWSDNTQNCRSAYRGNLNPDNRTFFVGFRVVFVP